MTVLNTGLCSTETGRFVHLDQTFFRHLFSDFSGKKLGPIVRKKVDIDLFRLFRMSVGRRSSDVGRRPSDVGRRPILDRDLGRKIQKKNGVKWQLKWSRIEPLG